MQELRFLKKIADCEDINGLPVLRDNFTITSHFGEHLCLLMDPMSSDVGSLRRSSPTKCLPIYMVKNIVASVLEGLEQLHDLSIVHTGTIQRSTLNGLLLNY